MGVLKEKLRRTITGIRKQVVLFYSPFVQKGWQPPALGRERKPDVNAGLWLKGLTSTCKACGYEGLYELTLAGSEVTDVMIQKEASEKAGSRSCCRRHRHFLHSHPYSRKLPDLIVPCPW